MKTPVGRDITRDNTVLLRAISTSAAGAMGWGPPKNAHSLRPVRPARNKEILIAIAGGGFSEDPHRLGSVPSELRYHRVHAVVVKIMAERSLAEVEVSPGVSHDELVPEVVAPAGLRDKWDGGVGRMRKQERLELG